MKKLLQATMIVALVSGAMFFASCEAPNTGKEKDPEEQNPGGEEKPKDEVPSGEFEADTDNAGHVVTEIPEDKLKDTFESSDKTYEEFLDELTEVYENGTMDNLALNEDKTFTLTLVPGSLFPIGDEFGTVSGDPFTIPDDVEGMPADAATYTIKPNLNAIILSVDEEYGDQIFENLFGEKYNLFKDQIKDISTGLFSVKDGKMSLNYKYRETDDEIILYIDKDLLESTLEMLLGALNAIQEPDQDVADFKAYIKDYLKFVNACEKIEFGTILKKK